MADRYPVAGYQVVDVGVELYDGSYHEVDSSEMAFKIAASMAFKEASRKAKPVLLEPIFKVEVTVPEEYMGDIIGDISSRRGRIEGSDMRQRNGCSQRNGTAFRNVRLRDRPEIQDTGPRRICNADGSLRTAPCKPARKGYKIIKRNTES